MEKKKKTKIKVFGLKLKELIRLGTIVGACFWAWNFLDKKFDSIDRKFDSIDRKFDAIDRKFERIDQRFDQVDKRLDKIESELTKTSDLLDTYLTWRFIYVNDPLKKNLIPIYDPRTRTLEFVPRK